jgi:hypothetical protein
MPPGDYEVQGEGAERTVTGDCAGCGLLVKPGEPHRILYHPPERGGIFHAACAPTGRSGTGSGKWRQQGYQWNAVAFSER